MEKMRKAIEAREKLEADTVESEKAWADTKARDRAEISRLADKYREKNKFEARAKKNANFVNRAVVEADTNIRFSDKIQGAKRDKAEAETRANDEAEIREKTKEINKSAEAEARG